MLHKISLATLFCLSPIAMGELATAGHGCHHSAAATHYRAPVGHSHAGHWHHAQQAPHHAVSHSACCGAPSHHAYSAYRGMHAYSAYGGTQAYARQYPHAPSSTPRRPLVYDGYVLGADSGYSSFRPNYDADPFGGIYADPYRGMSQAPSGPNPFAGARLDLRID